MKRKPSRRSEREPPGNIDRTNKESGGTDIEGKSVNGEKGERPTMDPGRDMIQHVGGSPVGGDILMGVLIILLIIYFWTSTG